MKLSIFDIIVAEGTEAECAVYTGILLDILRQVGDKMKEVEAQKDIEAFRKLFNKSFDDLIRGEGNSE